MQQFSNTLVLRALCCLIFTMASNAFPADPAAIRQSISLGSQFLKGRVSNAADGDRTLMALAILKSGEEPSSPAIAETVKSILAKFDAQGEYQPKGHHLYEAGVDANLLADTGGEDYQTQIEAIARYIIKNRKPDGGWDYPGSMDRKNNGDTSVVQYCCLGLWAAERVRVKVDPAIWVDVINWHIKNHEADGGYAYTPGFKVGDGGGDSTLNMTAAALSSIHIALLHLKPGAELFMADPSQTRPKAVEGEAGPKFGVLEAVTIQEPSAVPVSPAGIPNGAFEVAKRAHGWFASRYRVTNEPAWNRMYYYYTMERMASFANITKIGNHDWYSECAEFLMTTQNPDGSFASNNTRSTEVETAFAVLFLTRSTGKLLKRKIAEPGFGDGLLAGGRGLPDDLSDVDFNGRTVKGKEKPSGPLDELLASLQNPGEINIGDLQEQIVQKVQLGDRETLVGKKDLLVKLVEHPDASVRQMAMWALGRTDDMRLAKHLIDGLSDVDPNVMMEAQNALCWIARRPRGIGLPENPLDAAPDGANPQQKQDAVLAWRRKALDTWGKWYLENRLYADRSDQFESKLRVQLERIRNGQEP